MQQVVTMGLYGLPFEGIKGIRSEIARLQQQEVQWMDELNALQQVMRTTFGYRLPLTLSRRKNKAYAPLMWRQGKTSRRLYGGLETPEGQGILKALPPEQQRELLNIEFKRIHLNHVVGLLQYEIARLKRLESEFEAWRDWMRDANRH